MSLEKIISPSGSQRLLNGVAESQRIKNMHLDFGKLQDQEEYCSFTLTTDTGFSTVNMKDVQTPVGSACIFGN